MYVGGGKLGLFFETLVSATDFFGVFVGFFNVVGPPWCRFICLCFLSYSGIGDFFPCL